MEDFPSSRLGGRGSIVRIYTADERAYLLLPCTIAHNIREPRLSVGVWINY